MCVCVWMGMCVDESEWISIQTSAVSERQRSKLALPWCASPGKKCESSESSCVSAFHFASQFKPVELLRL